MRVDLASLDQSSALARRISAAMRRDAAEAAQRLASMPGESATGVNLPLGGNSQVRGGTSDQNDKRPPTDSPAREIVLHLEVVELLRANCIPGVWWSHFPAGEKRSEATRLKLAMMGTKAGVPDFLLVSHGQLLGLELKTATGSMSGPQKITHAALIRAGAEIAVVRSLAETADVLRRWQCII
jgi:hypothetical protein